MSSQQTVKQCCARLYESDFAKMLLGDSLHPGGVTLTERLGTLLGLTAQSRVLDIASGKGTSALFLAERFGCEVLGIDYSEQNVKQASAAAAAKGVDAHVRFQQGDAERLPVADSSFDAIICECAFCTFPDKPGAADEFARVLRARGRVGISDLTRGPVLPRDLDGLLAWIACIADAQPVNSYIQYLSDAGFRVEHTEQHDEALLEMVNQMRTKLLGAEIMMGLKKLDLPDVDLSTAKQMAQAATSAIRQGTLGYVIVCGAKR
jgi:ubiquinone/menaquinone biosynthesis C-methylase UbiE